MLLAKFIFSYFLINIY